MRRAVGSILVILAAIGFGFMVLFASWARGNGVIGGGVSVEMMLFLRFAIAGAVMTGLMIVLRLPWPRGRTLMALLAMGAVLYVGESLFFFHATRHIPGPLVSLLLYIYPVIVTLYAWLVLRERLTMLRLAALALAIIGLLLTIVPELEKTQPISPGANATVGVMLGVLCAITYAIYILCGGRLSAKAGAIPASTVVILATAVVLGAVSIGRGDSWPQQSIQWTGVLGLALISTVLAITAVLAGLERIGPVATSTISTLEPVTTALVGATLMHDRLNSVQIAGGICIVFAAILVARSQTRDDPAA